MLITNEVLIHLVRKLLPCKESEKIIITHSKALTIPRPKPDEVMHTLFIQDPSHYSHTAHPKYSYLLIKKYYYNI
jgi:hypothetical protein